MGSFRIPFAAPPLYRGESRIPDLIMRGGQAQAEGHLRSGDIWGGAVANLGQQAGQAIQAHQMAKRDAAWVAYVKSQEWAKDPKAAYAHALKVWGPQEGPNQFDALMSAATFGQGKPEEKMKRLGIIIGAADKMKDPARAVLWPELRALGTEALPEVPLPEQYDPEFWASTVSPFGAQIRGEKPPEPYTLAQGAQRRGPNDELLAENPPEPPKPPAPPSVGSFEDYVLRRFGPQPKPEQIEAARKAYQQADDRPRITVNTPSGMSPTMEANVINRLTTQWGKAVAPVAELSRQVKLMDAGLDAARRGELAQGAQMVLVTFQKILDPPSVVRESEYMRSAAGLALMERVKGAFERLSKGGAGVPVGELEKFAALARQAAQAQSSGYVDAIKERIGRTADRFKIPRELVFEEFDFGAALSAPAAPAGGAPAGGPPRISSDADYDALPSGAEFIDPNGKRRRKP